MPLNSITQPQYTPANPAGRSNAAGSLEYMYLTEPGYLPLYVSPSTSRGMILQDFDLGRAGPRAVSENRTLGDGAHDYTKYLGTKSVSVTIMCRTDAYAQAAYYAALVSAWFAPARRPTMTYRLRGLPECQTRLRGNQLGAPISMATNRGNSIAVAGQWVGIDGKDYATATSSATVADWSVVANYGSADAEAVFTVNGPQPAGMLIVSDTAESRSGLSDARLGFTQAIDAGTYVVLDTRERTAQFNGLAGLDNSWRRYLSPARWFPLVAGVDNHLHVEGGGAGAITLSWNDAYL